MIPHSPTLVMSIQLATSDAQISQCFEVLNQLRPHLQQSEFLAQVQRQQQSGYQLVFLEQANQVVAVAGFNMGECLAWGKFMYVYDLVVAESMRSQGHGQQILQWLVDFAKSHSCQQLHLDSGVQRHAAHRFYLQQLMDITSHHFSLKL
jgi:N-acetylglutamate synthase-like GNAT family acetyltransferase